MLQVMKRLSIMES